MYPKLVKICSQIFLILLICSEISSLLLEADTCPEYRNAYLNDTSCQNDKKALLPEVCGFQHHFSREEPKNYLKNELTTNSIVAQIGEKVSRLSTLKNRERILPGLNTRNLVLENMSIFRDGNRNIRISKPNLRRISFIKPETTSERKITQDGRQTRDSTRSSRNNNSPSLMRAFERLGLRGTKPEKYSRYISTRLEISSNKFHNERSRDHERKIFRFGNDHRQRQNTERFNSIIDQPKFRSNKIDLVRFYREIQQNDRMVRNRSISKREIHRAIFERFSRRSYDKRIQPTQIQLINGHHIKKTVEPSRESRSHLKYTSEENRGTHHNIPLAESVRNRKNNDYKRGSIGTDFARDNRERHSRVISPSIGTPWNKNALKTIDYPNRIHSNYISEYQRKSTYRERNSFNRLSLHRDINNMRNYQSNIDRRSTSYTIYGLGEERISLDTQILSRKHNERESFRTSKEDRRSSSRNSRTNNRNRSLADLELRIHKRSMSYVKTDKTMRRTVYVNRKGDDSVYDTNKKIRSSDERVGRKSFKENRAENMIGRRNGNLRVMENQRKEINVHKNTDKRRNNYYPSKLFGYDDQIRQLARIILRQKTTNELQDTLETEVDRPAESSWLRSIQLTLATIILGQLILSGGNNGKDRVFDWRSMRTLRSF